MTVHIFTTVVNHPDFVEIQQRLFKKFLKNEYQFHIVDDSIIEHIESEFQSVCFENELKYYKKPPRASAMNPAQACADAVQWTYNNIIRKNHSEDIVFFLDSDMFLIDQFDIVEYMEDAIIAGLPQVRGHVTYMWNGIMFFNMPKIEDKDIDFSDGIVDGEITDVGGHTYYYFKKTGIEMKKTNEVSPTYPTHFNDIDLQKDAGGYNMELHLDSKFLHYRAATNWHTQYSWRNREDPLKIKAQLFNKIIEDIFNE